MTDADVSRAYWTRMAAVPQPSPAWHTPPLPPAARASAPSSTACVPAHGVVCCVTARSHVRNLVWHVLIWLEWILTQ